MKLNPFSRSSAAATAPGGYVETFFDGTFAAYEPLKQYINEEQPSGGQWYGADLPHIPANDSDPMPPIDTYFGDFFNHLWTPAQVPTAKPRYNNFLANTRAPHLPSAKPPIALRDVVIVKKKGPPTDWKFHESLKRVSAYGFRGDGRGPEMIKAANGFQPNSMRTDDHYIKGEVFEYFANYMEKRYGKSIQRDKIVLDDIKGDQKVITPDDFLGIVNRTFPSKAAREMFFYYTHWRALAKTEELHLGRHVAHAALKGYVSTTRAVTTAKGFATKGRTEGWVYCAKVRGSFIVPPKGGMVWIYDEQEIAVPKDIPWDDIVGFRKCVESKFDPAGRIYMRRSLEGADKNAWDTIFHLLSGKKQG